MSRRFTVQHGKLLLAVALDPREVGRRLAEARERKGWTQLEFALEVGASPSTIQRWEAGKLPPTRRLLRAAEVVGADPEQLVAPPLSSPRPFDDLLREVAAGLSELANTEQELLARVRDIQDRVARIEGRRPKRAASPAS